MKKGDKHTFSLFFQHLSMYLNPEQKDVVFQSDDRAINRRMTQVLRIRVGDNVVFFDGIIQASCIVQDIKIRGVVLFEVSSVEKTKPLQPEVILCPALLKKDFFESVAYTAAQMGAAAIQPLLTEKVQRRFGGDKESMRLKSIMIAACEQSKQFFLPILFEPIFLEKFLKKTPKDAKKIYFDCNGAPLFNALSEVQRHKYSLIMLAFGPEGDITDNEKQIFKKAGFEFVSLTPTILRSVEAVTVGLGSIRSVA